MLKSASIAFFALAAGASAGEVSFNREVRPLLNEHCVKCHGGVKEAGGMNLQFREEALKEGESGEIAIVPGKPEASAMIDRLTTDDKSERMPKKQPPLKPGQIAVLKQWIAEGARWERHWAYEPPRRAGKGVDALVEARLQREGLAFSPEANGRTLARRLALDLTGLPPELARVDALEQAADREAALRAYVDELLASPAYGERWAVPWLDLARYADSKGYESDRFRDMWRYRDWVVDALNEDMPYDRFVTEQLAGDLLPNATEEQVIATAFHRNTPQNDEGGTDDEEFRTYAVLDRVNATFDALQGTSIGCVQCHGHPYDPFTHREYYELMAFFNNTADADRDDQAPTRKVRSRAATAKAAALEVESTALRVKLDALAAAHDEAFKAWIAAAQPPSPAPAPDSTEPDGGAKPDASADEAFAKLPKDVQAFIRRAATTWKPDEREKALRLFLFTTKGAEAEPLDRQIETNNAARKANAATPVATLPIMAELTGKTARVTKVFHRGNWMDKAEPVEPKTPRILNPWPADAPRNRLGFAQWLTNGANPLTARVQVNRVWEQLFGTGLVETLEDFGSQGDKPPHQDVLDELAARFQTEMKWSQKTLVRELVLTRTYRQSSKVTKALLERDPANRLLARGPRFRLSSEQIRDQALALGGILSRKMAGPSVMPFQPPGTWLVPYEGRDWTTSPGDDRHRRALYTFIRRSATYPSMVTFDAPNREFCVVRRTRTNTPLQALDNLNSPVFIEAAAALAKRMTGATLDEQLARGLALATLRPARDYEIAALKKLHAHTNGDLRLVANAILNLDEVLTKN